jgi:WD40 repeat protein
MLIRDIHVLNHFKDTPTGYDQQARVRLRRQDHPYMGRKDGQSNRLDVIWTVTFSSDDRNLVSGSEDPTMRIWVMRTWQLVHRIRNRSATGAEVWGVVYPPIAGRGCSIGRATKNFYPWDVDPPCGPTGNFVLGHTECINAVAFSQSGTWLASAARDRTLSILDVATGKPISEPLTGHIHRVWAIAISPNGMRRS